MTPKNREELFKLVAKQVYDMANQRAIDEAKEFIEGIEALGVRLVPIEPTVDMMDCLDNGYAGAQCAWEFALKASPFAPAPSSHREEKE